MFSTCIFIGLLFLYDWYIVLSKEQLMEKVKRAWDEWKREFIEQAKQQREVAEQGSIRKERFQRVI
jgi:hypothetical protein